MSDLQPKIAIAGAGISGLVAALELQAASMDVTVFESRNRTGGRIQSIEMEGMVVETGPEFIHGQLKGTMALLEKYRIPFEPVDGKMYTARSGQIKVTDDFATGWDELLEKMQAQRQDLPLGKFLQEYFPGEKYRTLKQSAIRFAEGFDLADTETVSTRALYQEWKEEESMQYRVPGGYGTLISQLEDEFRKKGGKIFLESPVKQVHWDSRGLQIAVDGHPDFTFDQLLICLPLSLLNQSAPPEEIVIFHPALTEKQEAFQHIGFGTVVKMVMIWDSAFWDSLIPEAQFVFGDAYFPTWWTQYPRQLPMLTGWLGGPRAAGCSDQPDAFFLEKALESLAGIFSMPVENIKSGLRNFKVFNWQKEAWSRGAYSYPRVGYQEALAICRKPVLNRIFFAGESFYEGSYPGTVESAIVSGSESARDLLARINV